MANTICMLGKKGYINARECTRPRARVDARTYIQLLRERASLLRHKFKY
jgi:hypothetical protein